MTNCMDCLHKFHVEDDPTHYSGYAPCCMGHYVFYQWHPDKATETTPRVLRMSHHEDCRDKLDIRPTRFERILSEIVL
jgi:hypothetical protein